MMAMVDAKENPLLTPLDGNIILHPKQLEVRSIESISRNFKSFVANRTLVFLALVQIVSFFYLGTDSVLSHIATFSKISLTNHV